jgi:hypothetical protein
MGILLTAVTCGIYGMYWWWKMASEVNAFLGEEKFSVLKFAGLSTVTCGLYGMYFMFVEGKDIIKAVQAKAGQPEAPPFMCDIGRFQGALNKVWEQLP